MYVPPASALASSKYNVGQTDPDDPALENRLVYSRESSASASSSSVQTPADFLEEGRLAVMKSWEALQQYIDSPAKVVSTPSRVEKMTLHLRNLIYYGQVKNIKGLQDSLKSLSGLYGFGYSNQRTAIDAAQRLFFYGGSGARRENISNMLVPYVNGASGDLVVPLRNLYPEDFLNTDTIRSVCDAARLYGKAEGDVVPLCFDTDPHGAMERIGKCFPNDLARYAAQIWLTKPVGYMSTLKDNVIHELRDPTPQISTQNAQVVDSQAAQPRSGALKRGLGSEDPTDQTDPSLAFKRLRGSGLQHAVGGAWPSASTSSLISNERSPVESSHSAALSDTVTGDHNDDREERIRKLALHFSEKFEDILSVSGFSGHALQGWDRSPSPSVLPSQISNSILTDGQPERTATTAFQLAPGAETDLHSSELDDIVNGSSQDAFPHVSLADLVASRQWESDIAGSATRRIQGWQSPQPAFTDLDEIFNLVAEDSNAGQT